MSDRRRWADLTPTYRRRLERAGVTPESYAAGASLQTARGHKATPERPERAVRDVDRFAEYLRLRTRPMRVITTHGLQVLAIPDPRERSRIGTYDNAVKNMLAGKSPWRPSGQPGGTNLADFAGATVRGYPQGSSVLRTYTLLTDADELTVRYFIGELRYEQIYPQTA
ncbi:MAG: hypothetical protein M3N46_04720 [Actinomycetota bacterium]|nr:hypothetical protein [Actinomycetota bacterium]